MESAADLSRLEMKHLVRIGTEQGDGAGKSVGNAV